MEKVIQEIDVAIAQLSPDEKRKCLDSLKKVYQKETEEGEISEIKEYYQALYKQTSEKIGSLNSAVIELNTREAIQTGYLKEDDFDQNLDDKIHQDLLKLYFERQITYYNTDNARQMMHSEQKDLSNQMEKNI